MANRTVFGRGAHREGAVPPKPDELQKARNHTMNNPFKFFAELMRQPLWIPLWVFVLMLVNVASAAFWSEPTARLIIVTFMVSSILMMGLYARFGFSKILGCGHVLWIPLLLHVLTRLPSAEGAFRAYLIVWCLVTAVSLAFDVVDVWKYWQADRKPHLPRLNPRKPASSVLCSPSADISLQSNNNKHHP
jgi:hypothetical protein